MIKLLKNSLHILPEDTRDFNLGAVFKQIDIIEVPNTDFVVAEPLSIKEQPDGDDECSGYAVTSVSEDQEGIELLPQYQFLKTKEISGQPEEWGADLRDACKSAVNFGSLPLNGFEQLKEFNRSEAVDVRNWPWGVDNVAQLYKKASFFAVTGRYDTFDNIRTWLWKNKDKKCSIVTGALFREEWLDAPLGVIPGEYGNDGFGHAFKIFGQKIINNEIYLVAQLSQGKSVGDDGLFYFSRKVVNKEIGRYGIFMFNDMPKEEVKNILKNKSRVSFFINPWSFLTSIFTR